MSRGLSGNKVVRHFTRVFPAKMVVQRVTGTFPAKGGVKYVTGPFRQQGASCFSCLRHGSLTPGLGSLMPGLRALALELVRDEGPRRERNPRPSRERHGVRDSGPRHKRPKD